MTLDPGMQFWHVVGNPAAKVGYLSTASVDFERRYLPIIGPSGIAITRFLVTQPDVVAGYAIEPCELAYQCGIGSRGLLARAMARLDDYGVIVVDEPCSFTINLAMRVPAEQTRRQEQVRERFTQLAEQEAQAV